MPDGEPFASMHQIARVPETSATGSFVYSIPIEVPAGRGPAPELALTYDSQQGNGIAGVGWSLTGIPAIERVHGDRARARKTISSAS